MSNGDASQLVDGDHVVQFYADDRDLVDVVVGYLVASVLDGDAVAVLATPEHRDLFVSGMRRAGVDVEGATRSGQVLVLDAAETLAEFMVDGMPDASAFRRAVGDLIEAAGADDRAVRAFGEMVAILWAEGNREAAVELERLWNELADELSFALFCAYPANAVSDPAVVDGFAHLCHLHSDVVAGAPTPPDAQATRRFAKNVEGPRLARAFVVETLHAWSLGELIDDCLLVVTELATNAVRHAASEFTVSLSRVGDIVQLAVGDRSAGGPEPRRAGQSDAGGRGLHLVEAIAEDWGHVTVENGKLVWAQLGISA